MTAHAWHLDPLLFLSMTSPLIFHLIVSSKEHGIKAHFVKEPSIGVRMAKRINLPSNSWLHSKLLEGPLLAIHHVVDHILI
jgi:hypothetical protein